MPRPRPRATRTPSRERNPLAIRVGSLLPDLDARCDGSDSGYRTTIKRDLRRFYALMEQRRDYWTPRAAEEMLDRWREGDTLGLTVQDIDALERAEILIQHVGLPVDEALISVGMVKEE